MDALLAYRLSQTVTVLTKAQSPDYAATGVSRARQASQPLHPGQSRRQPRGGSRWQLLQRPAWHVFSSPPSSNSFGPESWHKPCCPSPTLLNAHAARCCSLSSQPVRSHVVLSSVSSHAIWATLFSTCMGWLLRVLANRALLCNLCFAWDCCCCYQFCFPYWGNVW